MKKGEIVQRGEENEKADYGDGPSKERPAEHRMCSGKHEISPFLLIAVYHERKKPKATGIQQEAHKGEKQDGNSSPCKILFHLLLIMMPLFILVYHKYSIPVKR